MSAVVRAASDPFWAEFDKEPFESLEFLVVQDGYHPTPTSEYAHLMLPAAMWGEKDGTYTNSERRVSKVNRAVAPPAEARADFDIFLGLAKSVVFAVLIGLTASSYGLRVRGGAEEVGRVTTATVVTSFFLVIVADSLFTIGHYLIR